MVCIMAYTLADLATLEAQILKLQTAKRMGDMSLTYGELDAQLRVRDMIITDLQAQGLTVPGAPAASARPRVYRINTSRGL